MTIKYSQFRDPGSLLKDLFVPSVGFSMSTKSFLAGVLAYSGDSTL